MKRLLAIMLAAVMLVGMILVIASCENGDKPDTTTAAPSTDTKATQPEATTAGGEQTSTTAGGETPTEPVTTGGETPTTPTGTTSGGPVDPGNDDGYSKPAGYLDVDFGGRTFSFVTTSDRNDPEDGFRWNTEREVVVESRTGGTVIDTAVYDRNAVMKRLYNCEIKAVEGAATTLISNDVNSGTNEYDIGIWQNQGVANNKSGYLVNVYNLNPDFNLPGWNRTFFDQLTVRDKNGVDKLYCFDADCNIVGYRATWVLFCGLEMYNANFSESIFDIVKRGEWTVDKMIEMVSAVTQDNGDQVMKGGEDTFGLMSSTYNSIAVITSMGLRFVGVDPETHTFNVSTDQILSNNAVSALDKAIELYALEGTYVGSYSLAREEIQAGRTLFMGEVLDVLERMKDNENLNVTVLPEPLYQAQENPEYKFYVNTKSSYYGVSKNACGGDMDMISDFLNVWVYHSNKIVYPAFRQAYGSIYCQDERAMEMLDYIINGRQYDLSYHKGTSAMGQVQDFIHQGKNTLNRAANSFVKTLQSMVDTFVDDMTASE